MSRNRAPATVLDANGMYCLNAKELNFIISKSKAIRILQNEFSNRCTHEAAELVIKKKMFGEHKEYLDALKLERDKWVNIYRDIDNHFFQLNDAKDGTAKIYLQVSSMQYDTVEFLESDLLSEVSPDFNGLQKAFSEKLSEKLKDVKSQIDSDDDVVSVTSPSDKDQLSSDEKTGHASSSIQIINTFTKPDFLEKLAAEAPAREQNEEEESEFKLMLERPFSEEEHRAFWMMRREAQKEEATNDDLLLSDDEESVEPVSPIPPSRRRPI